MLKPSRGFARRKSMIGSAGMRRGVLGVSRRELSSVPPGLLSMLFLLPFVASLSHFVLTASGAMSFP